MQLQDINLWFPQWIGTDTSRYKVSRDKRFKFCRPWIDWLMEACTFYLHIPARHSSFLCRISSLSPTAASFNCSSLRSLLVNTQSDLAWKYLECLLCATSVLTGFGSSVLFITFFPSQSSFWEDCKILRGIRKVVQKEREHKHVIGKGEGRWERQIGYKSA